MIEHDAITDEYHIPLDVVNHSMMKTFRRCPRQARYKYGEQLLPKVESKPLTRGKWFHALLEAHYLGEDWMVVHKQWCREFAKLFDEEKEHLGDLPREMLRLFRSYLWHYKEESEWEVIEVEKTIHATLPNGMAFKGKVDMLVRDNYGLWLVDHKTHKVLPELIDRQLDTQSPAYIWACWENGIDVNGFIWNYIKTKAPSQPQMLKSGKRFSKKLGETDYYTFAVALKRSGLPVEDYRDTLDYLKAQRYKFGELSTSPFFQRHIIERTDESVAQAIRELSHTAMRMRDYNFDPSMTERVSDRSCKWMCSYRDLCVAELHGHKTNLIMRNYRTGDPLEYYEDNRRDDY